MSWLATGLGGRAAAIGASVAAHASVVLAVSGGHAGAARTPVPSTAALEIAVEVAQPEPVPAKVESEAPRAPVHAAHTHTHPYPVPADHDLHPHDPSLVHVPAALAHDRQADQDDSPAEAPAVTAASAPVAHFTMALGASAVSYGAVTTGGAGVNGAPALADDPPVAASSVSVPARLAERPTGVYPEDARRAGIEGDVPLEIVVDTRGAVVDARVLRPAGYGLDEAALANVRRYRFTPAQKDGHAVRVRMTWPVQFRLE